MTPVSEIKLIRTDTTLDLSQKAEKVCSWKTMMALKKQKTICTDLWVTPISGPGKKIQ